MKKSTAFYIGSSVVLLTLVFALLTKPQDAQEPAVSSEESASGVYWRERIADVGGERAYEEFSRAVERLSFGARHRRAHAFGGALYAIEDLAGLAVCDARFSYGCFHEFLGRAIAEHGLASVSELNEGCQKALVESPLSCQHGIGHGVLAYFGYEEPDLHTSLAVCKDLPYNDPIGGCYGGVFMEYNLRTMLAGDGGLRELEGSVHDPCDRLADPYKVACVYWQPQWWLYATLSGSATPESYERMGAYCREAGETEQFLRACFEGLGTITAFASGYDPHRTAALCEVASSDMSERLWCTALAANAMGIDVDVPTAEQACAQFSGEQQHYCVAYARNEANILNVRSTP